MLEEERLKRSEFIMRYGSYLPPEAIPQLDQPVPDFILSVKNKEIHSFELNSERINKNLEKMLKDVFREVDFTDVNLSVPLNRSTH